MAVLLTAGVASAYVYGFDPAKGPLGGNSIMYMELAQDPTLVMSGPYAGKYEYFFDLYNINTTFYFLHLVGLDNSKIANAQTIRPDAGVFKTQRWGDPNGAYEAWPAATGRLLDFWSKGRNDDLASATAFDVSRTSYDDGSGGWTDSGLGYAGSSTDNPHAYGDYVNFSGMSSREIWKAELTGPGQPLHWWNTQFGVVPAQDTIYIAGSTTWASPGAVGLVLTLRVVYDDVIDPATIGWSGDATLAWDVLGDFTVVVPPATLGDFDDDGDIDADDIDNLCANMGGAIDPYDVDEDGDVDADDMTYLIENLVEWDNGVDSGVGTWQGDFNLDGVVNATDLAIMKGTFGTSGVGYAGGNANCDTVVNATDLAILKGTFGLVAPTGGGVPEPASLTLLTMGGLALLRKRRK